jgi:hypothetical protein
VRAQSLFTRSPRGTPQCHRAKPNSNTSRLRITKVADGSRRTKKTCPSRSKERHSCHLVTCTRSGKPLLAPVPSCIRLPKRRTPTRPNRDIDAFATEDRLIAIFARSQQFQGTNLSRLSDRRLHKNPLASIAVQPPGPKLRLPCLPVTESASFFDVYLLSRKPSITP